MKLSDGFNGADLRNVCTEAGRSSRAAVTTYSDFLKLPETAMSKGRTWTLQGFGCLLFLRVWGWSGAGMDVRQ